MVKNVVGSSINGYHFEKAIGAGGFATIYLATHEASHQLVAIKVIQNCDNPSARHIQQIENEAAILSNLDHPHIMPVYDYWRDDDGAYLVMRWIRGGSLRQWLKKVLPMAQIVKIIKQVASALDYAHSCGIVHRDIKPDNILFDEAGDVILADFGIAHDLNTKRLQPKDDVLVGSPTYIPPEQLKQQFIPEGDIYSLGIMLYEMLTHELPFQGDTTRDILLKQLFTDLPLLPEHFNFPMELNDILQIATAKSPVVRYESAEAMAGHFAAVINVYHDNASQRSAVVHDRSADMQTRVFEDALQI